VTSSTHRRTASAIIGSALAGALLVGVVPAGAQTVPSSPFTVRVETEGRAPSIERPAYGLTTTNTLVRFDLDRPSRFDRPVRLSGVPAGSTIVGIDERPKTGALYAVLRAADGAASFAIVDPATGAVSSITPLVTALSATVTARTPIVLTGERVGVDFNPQADALRITGDDGQNLRALPSDRVTQPNSVSRLAGDTFTDGTLSYAPLGTDPRPVATGITASAYTQNLPVTAATTLLNVDSTLEDLTVQAPPNDGTQTLRADLALGGRTVLGFDILTTGTTDEGFIGLSTPDRAIRRLLDKIFHVFGIRLPARTTPTEIVSVDLTTGQLTRVGTVGGNALVDFAVDTPAPVTP
jgi:hypothetical protein